ncbi:MAG TPA: DUF1801 domain-containing protein [Flavobacteriales bacterium]|nr:DUF1801 domain-containing protein [Flavobacteriales bacterium]
MARSKYTLKTKANIASLDAFINKQPKEEVRDDCRTLLKLMGELAGEEACMWGPSIIGFGSYHYKYASGHEGDMCRIGFSPRKTNISIYLLPGFDAMGDLLEELGKYNTGKSCLYVKRLADIDLVVLRKMAQRSLQELARCYPAQ